MEFKEDMETGTETEQRTSHWDQPWKTEAREITEEGRLFRSTCG